MAMLDRGELELSPLSDLHAIAAELGIEGYRKLRRDDLIETILGDGNGDGPVAAGPDAAVAEREAPQRSRARGGRGRSRRVATPAAGTPAEDPVKDEPPKRRAPKKKKDDEPAASERESANDEDEEEPSDEPEETRSGVLDILPNGSGFMRPDPFAHSRDDVYVSPAQIRRCELRAGDTLEGPVRRPRRSERHPSLVRVETVSGRPAEPPAERPRFDSLTPVFASKRLTAPEGLDAVPFGRGSRVAVGGPPGSGITTLLRRIALALAASDDGLEVVVVLAGTRPEEVTEWRRDEAVTVAGGGFDRPIDDQAQAADFAVERGKRAVEEGRDAVVVIDSLDALPPAVARRVFGAARATEEAGSLTVIASSGLAGEPLRLATTRIVLEGGGDPGPHPPRLAPASGTLRADRLR
ncbi:MAG: hypothetical protein NVSMB25_21170 [Thermoleophilaceae bacterium]